MACNRSTVFYNTKNIPTGQCDAFWLGWADGRVGLRRQGFPVASLYSVDMYHTGFALADTYKKTAKEAMVWLVEYYTAADEKRQKQEDYARDEKRT